MIITSDVAIVGGGIAGLSAALALARSGIAVTVLEAGEAQKPDHWGLVIWPAGVRALGWLGVLDRVEAEGSRLQSYRWSAKDGREWFCVDLQPLADAGEWLGILPSKLVDILATELRPNDAVRILKGFRFSALSQAKGGLLKVEGTIGGKECAVTARLVVGADGPDSSLRRTIGIKSWRWRPRGQVIVTGIGGGLKFNELRQSIGTGWSAGCVTLGGDKSWLYSTVRKGGGVAGLKSVQAYAELDRQAASAFRQLESVIEVRPWSVRVKRWAADGVVLIGDAAHPVLPHLGLGGNLTLGDIPVLEDVVIRALRTGNTSASALDEVRRRRSKQVSYARRISELWALSMTSKVPGLQLVRDLNFWRMSRHPEFMAAFLRELSGSQPPDLWTRARVWLP
ncbi:MAG: NAD(P)/FAD-dependent oxidoreductase [Blastocatellia bacterium]